MMRRTMLKGMGAGAMASAMAGVERARQARMAAAA